MVPMLFAFAMFVLGYALYDPDYGVTQDEPLLAGMAGTLALMWALPALLCYLIGYERRADERDE
jgi:hypothetical protein